MGGAQRRRRLTGTPHGISRIIPTTTQWVRADLHANAPPRQNLPIRLFSRHGSGYITRVECHRHEPSYRLLQWNTERHDWTRGIQQQLESTYRARPDIATLVSLEGIPFFHSGMPQTLRDAPHIGRFNRTADRSRNPRQRWELMIPNGETLLRAGPEPIISRFFRYTGSHRLS